METVIVAYAVKEHPIVTIDNTYRGEKDIWAIRSHGRCLNKDGKFEHEPSASHRNEAFFARCRFTLDEANKLLDTDEVKLLMKNDIG